MLQKGVFNSMTAESACLAGRNNIEKMIFIRSHCHEISTEEINKIALSSDDDKQVIMADGIHTLAYRHKKCLKKIIKNELQWVTKSYHSMDLEEYFCETPFLQK